MEKDDTISEEGMVEEEDLLDFDLDDLASEEGAESEGDEEIIELVDLVTDEGEGVEFEDAGEEIKTLLDDDAASGDAPGDIGKESTPDDFDSMLDDVDLDETVADIDMSDVALDLDLGAGEGSGEKEADLSSILDEEGEQETSFDFEEPAGLETPAEVSEPAESAGLESGDEDISADDLQKMLEDEAGEEFDFDLPSDDESVAFDEIAETESASGDDVTEEALERMLEDETADELAEGPAPGEEQRFTSYDDTVVDTTPAPPPEGIPVSGEKVEEIVRVAVEEVIARDLPQVLADTAERVIRESMTETAERVIRESLTDTVERVIRESLADSAERVIRESVTGTAERIIRETIDALKAGLDTAGD